MNFLNSKNIKLVKFTDEFVTPEYIGWLNNYDINKYLCTGRLPISKDDITNRNDHSNIMFAILSNMARVNENIVECDDYSEYIGTISVNKIDWISRHAEVGYCIGSKRHWGMGLATQSVSLISDYCLKRINLYKIEAGVVDGNVGSIKALEKNGFKQYGTIPQEHMIDGKYYDVHRFYKLQEWNK